MSEGLRIVVVGATGALGSEVLAILSESSLPVGTLVPVATERSLGAEIEFRGVDYPVETALPALRGADLVFSCGPAAVGLEVVRAALRAEVPVVDASGALAGAPEAPLRIALPGAGSERESSPLLVSPPGRALALALVLRPLETLAPLRRVVATCHEAASSAGRDAIETLYRESIALFTQEETPETAPAVGRPLAFDCVPAVGAVGEEGASDAEQGLAAALARLLAPGVGFALTCVRVPAFVGFGATLAVEAASELDPKRALEVLAAAPGVAVWSGDADGATLRAAAGQDEVLVARLRRDASAPHALQLWLTADVLRLAAVNAVRLAVARLGLHH